MKNFLSKSLLLAIVFILLKPPKTEAQYCPVQVYNNSTTIGIVSPGLYNAVSNGTYQITMISSIIDPGPNGECWLQAGLGNTVTVTKSQDVMGQISGVANSGGWGIYFNVAAALASNNCPNSLPLDQTPPNDWNAIQEGAFSLELIPVQGGGGNVIVTVNFTDFNMDDCVITIVPVIWGNFTTTKLTSPNRVKLDWQTHTEQDVDHFSVYKAATSNGVFYKLADQLYMD
jgi:hypothetical protein